MEMQLKDRVALVTGATRDVGREIALTLAGEGARVAVHYHGASDAAEKVVAEIKSHGGQAKAYQADIADNASVQKMIAGIVTDMGSLNVLISNAGLAIRKPFKDTTPEEWRKQIDVNLLGAIQLCHAAGPHLVKGGNGRIIAIVGDSSRVGEAGLTNRVSIEYRDYRNLTGTFTTIVSIEMLEAVGFEFLPHYFATCARLLAPRGRLAIQSITMPDDRFEAYRRRVDWMQTYIFPGTLIPSLAAIRAASPQLQLADTLDIGPSYAPTLAAWRERFVAELPAVRALGFDEPIIRTWLLYLAFSEAAFAERTLGDHQLLFTSRR